MSIGQDDVTARLTARIQRAQEQLSARPSRPPAASGATPSAPPMPATSAWSFLQPLGQALPGQHQASPFSVHIKPREPPVFTGERGQDVVTWLRTVEDYLEFVTCSERQAIAYIVLLLAGNARVWWDAEYVSRGYRRPDSLEEFKMLLKTQFESPVRENRARTELLSLAQRKGENACTYMARTKTLLHKVPGYDMKTALQQWILGLRQPYRLEAAKSAPRTLAEAELLVSPLEDACEFSKAGKEESSSGSKNKSSSDQQQGKKKANKNAGNSGGNWGKLTQGQSSGNKGQQSSASHQQTQQNRGQGFNCGQGQAGQPRPPQQVGPQFHPGQQSGGSGQSGRGRNCGVNYRG